MAIFENPNSPVQPQIGTYEWYAKKDGIKTTSIYIGMAGKQATFLCKGTLFRGVSELQRNTFTSNAPDYNALDTDFIVGTAILFFEKNGYECIWRHLSNDPEDELKYVKFNQPILQHTNSARILDKYRLKAPEKNY